MLSDTSQTQQSSYLPPYSRNGFRGPPALPETQEISKPCTFDFSQKCMKINVYREAATTMPLHATRCVVLSHHNWWG